MSLQFDAVVVSDLHLGARNSCTDEFLEFLDALQTNRLIVNGDLFDDERLRGLRPRDIRVIDALRQFGRTSSVEWLLGNHDPPEDWFAGLLGLNTQDEAYLDVGDGKYLVYHGHGWDRSMSLPTVVIATADAIYAGCQWLDPTHRLARTLKRKSKMFCRAVEQLRRKAIKAATDRDLRGVILGHTHVAHDAWYDGRHYLNSGCWTEQPCGYIGIRDGVARHYTWCGDSLIPRESEPLPATPDATPNWSHDDEPVWWSGDAGDHWLDWSHAPLSHAE